MDLMDEKIEIMPFEDRYAEEFKRLNSEWLNKQGFLNSKSFAYLNKPWQTIIKPGGKILMAVVNGAVVGTCAIVKKNNRTAEFTKLVVSPNFRRKGIGRLLTIVTVNLAQKMEFKKIFLVSNKKSTDAIRLYKSAGFRHAAVPADSIYALVNIYMEHKIN